MSSPQHIYLQIQSVSINNSPSEQILPTLPTLSHNQFFPWTRTYRLFSLKFILSKVKTAGLVHHLVELTINSHSYITFSYTALTTTPFPKFDPSSATVTAGTSWALTSSVSSFPAQHSLLEEVISICSSSKSIKFLLGSQLNHPHSFGLVSIRSSSLTFVTTSLGKSSKKQNGQT